MRGWKAVDQEIGLPSGGDRCGRATITGIGGCVCDKNGMISLLRMQEEIKEFKHFTKKSSRTFSN